jgi:hypothetical protein
VHLVWFGKRVAPHDGGRNITVEGGGGGASAFPQCRVVLSEAGRFGGGGMQAGFHFYAFFLTSVGFIVLHLDITFAHFVYFTLDQQHLIGMAICKP